MGVHLSHTPVVAGSSPACPTFQPLIYFLTKCWHINENICKEQQVLSMTSTVDWLIKTLKIEQ